MKQSISVKKGLTARFFLVKNGLSVPSHTTRFFTKTKRAVPGQPVFVPKKKRVVSGQPVFLPKKKRVVTCF